LQIKREDQQERAALGKLRRGDTLVVWKLDRLGRSIQHLIAIIKLLNEKHVGFKSLLED